jgi:hypothetical protein
MSNKPKIIFIIGMHRCGTSLLANCLVENNFSIGKTKNQDKNLQNPNGYYENDAFTDIHEELLHYNQSNWCLITKEKMNYTYQHIEAYRNLLKTEFENENLILIKDPRLTFFVDFLKEVCGDDYEYNFLFLTRNKQECCNSLNKAQKNNMRGGNSETLYDITMKHYNPDFLKIDHHDTLFNNEMVIKNISEFCNIDLNKNTNYLVDMKLYRNRV